jgi:hypothetical protein
MYKESPASCGAFLCAWLVAHKGQKFPFIWAQQRSKDHQERFMKHWIIAALCVFSLAGCSTEYITSRC